MLAGVEIAVCRVYWGSHGCQYRRGHDGYHRCDCADDDDWTGEDIDDLMDGSLVNAAVWPYYGPTTWFYGEDSNGLPQVSSRDEWNDSIYRRFVNSDAWDG